MTIYELHPDHPAFPHPDEAEPNGLLAVGGDLTLERLLTAYANGIFPWYSDDAPILWWSPDPRLILLPDEFHIPRSLRRVLNRGDFSVTWDTAFDRVIDECARASRPVGDGTWITTEMMEAYCLLHRAGYAHSVEAWQDGELAGGIYGVAMGRAFFGESMFHNRDNGSKVALCHLVRRLADWDFQFIDCQQTTEHMLRFGAREVSRDDFLERLDMALGHVSRRGVWTVG